MRLILLTFMLAAALLSGVLSGVVIGVAHAEARSEEVVVYTNATFPPLVIQGTPGRAGIYPDLIAYLNSGRVPGLTFRLSHLPRKRLQKMLEDQQLDGIVIGMSPQWFDDDAQTRYLWTAPFSIDRFVLARRPALTPGAPVPGQAIGMVLGYVYPGVDKWAREQGLQRQDAYSEEANLEKLRLGRVDYALVAESVLNYYHKTHAARFPRELPFASDVMPSRPTDRRFLVPHSKAAVYDKLAPAIRKLKDDPAWHKVLAQYQ